MKEFFEKIWKDYLFSSVVTVIAGLLITIFYKVALDIVCVVLGVIAFCIGIVTLIKYLRYASVDSNRYILLMSLIFCALGIYVTFNPSILINIVAVVFGIIVIFHAVIDMQETFAMKKAQYKYWYVALIISIITLILGILLIVLKREVADSFALMIGLMLLAEGLMNIWVAVKVKKING